MRDIRNALPATTERSIDNAARTGFRTCMDLMAAKPAKVPFVAVPMWDDIAIEADNEQRMVRKADGGVAKSGNKDSATDEILGG